MPAAFNQAAGRGVFARTRPAALSGPPGRLDAVDGSAAGNDDRLVNNIRVRVQAVHLALLSRGGGAALAARHDDGRVTAPAFQSALVIHVYLLSSVCVAYPPVTTIGGSC